MYMKYLETLEHPIAKMTLDSAQKGNHVVIEIDPKFFFTWDFAKMQDFESNFVIIKKYRIHCHHTSLLLLDLSNHGLLVHLVMVAVQSLLPQKFKQINNSYLLVKMNIRKSVCM